MPYEGEYAGYRALRRVAENERVKQLLGRSRVRQSAIGPTVLASKAPDATGDLPRFVLAIDGSYAEVAVNVGYPGARVGYCTVASVLLDLKLISELDENRPVDPVEFRRTEETSAIDAALPGSNVVTRRQDSAVSSFREELFDQFSEIVIDEDERTALLETYEVLLDSKPPSHGASCPYSVTDNCDGELAVQHGHSACPMCKRPVFSTDALRIHERFNDFGSNGEAFGLVMQVWERVLLVHLLRCFEKREMLGQMNRIAFFLDGPLAVFGPPAWLSAAIQSELQRLNQKVRELNGNDLMILGIEKSGNFVNHFEEIDHTETPGELRFGPRTYLMLTDAYIKERIIQSTSSRRYGQDTYFGRKFYYKAASGARIVGTVPFLSELQDTLADEDIDKYTRFPDYCALLDLLVSSRINNAVSPLIAAHAQAAIPLHLGEKVLRQLAIALMKS